MRLNKGKSLSKLLGLWSFFLLLLLKGAFSKPAAALSTLDSCAAQPACRTALGSELAPSVTAPTGAGWGASTLTTTTATGATSTVQAVAPVAFVGDMRLSGIVAYYIWKQSQNEKAQERAKYRYCATYPKDWVCTPFEGGQGDGVVYRLIILFDITYVGRENNVQHGGANLLVYGPIGEIKTYFEPYPGSPNDDCWGLLINSRGFYASGHVGGGCPGIGNMYAPSVQKNYKVAKGYGGKVKTITIKSIQVQNADVKPDTNGNPPPLPWKEWPQEKRNLAVDLLQPADWFEFVKEMPVGGVLLPGDKVEPRPGGVITPGNLEDDPNTPEDERLPRRYPDFTHPGNSDPDLDGKPNESDTDDDNDGSPDTSDPQPRNPAIPTANVEPPPGPSNPPENPGEPATGDGAFATEDTLPYAPPGKVVGQFQPDSCVAASCKMVIYDSTDNDIPESWLRDAARVDDGAPLQNAVDALEQFGVASHYESGLLPEALQAMTENKPVIVSVVTPTTGGEHALIVDGFENDYTLIRDPLPQGNGAAYKVKTETFVNAWTGKAVIVEP